MSVQRRCRVLPGLLLLVGSVGAALTPAPTTIRFVDAGAEAGVSLVTWHGRPDKPHLLESGGAGVALFDYDLDGDLDLYVVNGWRLDGAEVVERGANALYQNSGEGVFVDVTEDAGVGDRGWGTAVTVGDIDGDGHPDLFVTNFGSDVLYHNTGGRFEVIEADVGIDGWSSSSVFFDGDGDGDEDLFVTGYIETSLDDVMQAKVGLRWKNTEVMRGPFGFEGLANRYFVNDGAGNFSDATAAAGLDDVGLFYSFGVVATDLDADGLVDLYVANDSNPNYLYRNLGGGQFEEVGLWSGAALDHRGMAQAGMGIATADYDADGLPDLFVTNFADDTCTLYRNLGRMAFEDVSAPAGLVEPTFGPLSWGTVFADFDLDGDLDLFVANGHIYPQADSVASANTSFAQPNHMLEQTDDGFRDVSAEAGPGLEVRQSSRGVAVGDIDNDGDLDLVIANMDAPPSVLRNESARLGEWLAVDASGAVAVEVTAAGHTWRRQRVRGGSYASSSDDRFYFGLGSITGPASLRVRWPDGSVTERTGMALGQIAVVTR